MRTDPSALKVRVIWPRPAPSSFGVRRRLVGCQQRGCVRVMQLSCSISAGLGQITRTFNADGSVRMDALAEMRTRHAELRGLTWGNVYTRPDLQLRALVLMSRDNWRGLSGVTDPAERLAMVDASYNQGLGGTQRDRRVCRITRGCDPGRWWGHVERTCGASTAALYAGRSACDISRHHVRDVLMVRAPKYLGLA